MSETQAQRAAKQDRIARAALPRLSMLADELELLAREVFEKNFDYQRDDGASVMVVTFVTKQCEHLRSVRTLIEAKSHRDAHLIARTMLEGLGRLLWAFNRRPERTDLWFWYGAILDWRQTKRNEEKGIAVDPGEKAELKTYVDKHGPIYYRKAVRNAFEAATCAGTVCEIPEDPWRTNWTDTNIESMFVEIGWQPLYKGVYRDSSEWIHWGPRAILRAMERAEWGVSGFAEEDRRAASVALQVGCQALLQSLQELDLQFSLGITERLTELEETMSVIQTDAIETGGC